MRWVASGLVIVMACPAFAQAPSAQPPTAQPPAAASSPTPRPTTQPQRPPSVQLQLQQQRQSSVEVQRRQKQFQPCRLKGPRPTLVSENLTWTLSMRPDTTCLHGVRSAALVLERITIAEKPKQGEAVIQGYGLTYKPKPGFTGDDKLRLEFAGTTAKARGTTTIDVMIRVE